MKKIIYILFIISAFNVFGQNIDDLFRQGNEAYKKGDYQTAVGFYEKVLQTDKHSAELYFNLANAYYKLNQIAPSIYYYEKALQLNPKDEDIQYNLALANQMKIDRINKLPDNVFLRLKKAVNSIFHYNTWAWISIIGGFIGLAALLLFLFTSNSNTKRITFVAMFVSLIILSFGWYNAHYGYQLSNQKYGIVFKNQVDILTEPNLTADKVITLHEGTKVEILRQNEDWLYIKLPDGKKAWLLKTDIKKL
jgi:tetratricopeptide (TPR) repeat protein